MTISQDRISNQARLSREIDFNVIESFTQIKIR